MSDIGAINNPGGGSSLPDPVTPIHGGTGVDTSASTGVAQVATGTWSVSTALANGSTATTQSANSNDTKLATDAYCDRVIAAPLFTGNSVNNIVRVTTPFTSSASGATPITGLAWTLPANLAANYHFEAVIIGSEASSATALTFGLQDVTVAPTAGIAIAYGAMSAGTAIQTKTTTGINATTVFTMISFTPSGAVTNFWIQIRGCLEHPSNASTSVLQFTLGVGGGANTVTIAQDSYAKLSTTAN